MGGAARLWRIGVAGLLFVLLATLPGQVSAADPPPTITGVTASEAAGTFKFAVTGPASATIKYATANGSAVAPGDYTAVTAGNVGLDTAGKGEIPITIAKDGLDEPDEQFTVNLLDDKNAVIATATGTIQDDDAAPVATIGNSPDVTEGNAGGTAKATFTVTLSAVSGKTVSVNYATVDNTAKTPGDYTGTSGTLTIPAGTKTKDIPVNVTGDAVSESDETFFVILTQRDDTATIGEPHQGTAKIVDDDAKAKLSVNDAKVKEGDTGTTVDLTFTVTLTGATGQQVTVQWHTEDRQAVAPADYQQKSGQITFDPSTAATQTKTISVKVVGDKIDEADETFAVKLDSPSGADVADGEGIGTITDDDNTSLLTISDATADEPDSGTSKMTFTVTLAPASQRTVHIDYATADGTATAGSDYTAAGGTLTFAPGGPTTQQVTVEVMGDTVNEDNETLLVNLVGPSGALVADPQGHGTIVDKNAPPSLAIDDVVTAEGDGAFFTVTLAGATLRTVTVVAETAGGTATSGIDFQARRSVLTFAPGEKTKTFSVSVLDDTESEPQETFAVDIHDATNATITKSRGTATIQASDQQAAASQPPPTGQTSIAVKPAGSSTLLLPRMVLAPRVVIATAGGKAKLQMSCAKISPITCAGSVALETVVKPKLSLGRQPFSVKKGKHSSVVIKLSARGFKLLKQRRTLQARAIVVVKTGKTSLRVVPGVITLRAPKV